MSASSSLNRGKSVLIVLIAAALLLAVALHQLKGATADPSQAMAPPPPRVEVLTVASQEIRSWAEFSGRLTAVDIAEIKPLVGGTIQKVLFKDGEIVEEGQPLFLIDPRPHQAAVKLAEARLASASARAKLTADEFKRAERLVGDKLISPSDYDRAASDAAMAKAQVAEAEAALRKAELDLEYAHISAPVAGRISRPELTVGNVVEAGGNAPVLATIVANASLYAEFDVDEQTYVRFVRNAAKSEDAEQAGSQKSASAQAIPAQTIPVQTMPVQLTLDADRSVVYEGQLYAFDNRLNSASGTIRARALFANTDGALTAGMYARVRLGSPQKHSALLVPERAIGTNQDKKFVLVVDENNIAQYREVALGNQWRGQRVITAGVQAGDRIIVNGIAHVRPNTPVNPEPVSGDQVAALP